MHRFATAAVATLAAFSLGACETLFGRGEDSAPSQLAAPQKAERPTPSQSAPPEQTMLDPRAPEAAPPAPQAQPAMPEGPPMTSPPQAVSEAPATEATGDQMVPKPLPSTAACAEAATTLADTQRPAADKAAASEVMKRCPSR
jgi:predicted small secreted protein